ncbi:hypothetical protein JCM11251_003683 [Rhodosporidiobolus azoricus]
MLPLPVSRRNDDTQTNPGPTAAPRSFAGPSSTSHPALLYATFFTSKASLSCGKDEMDDVDAPLLPRYSSSMRSTSSKEVGETDPVSTRPPRSSPSYGATLRRTRRANRFTILLYTLLVAILSLTVFFALFILGWSAHVMYSRHNAYAQAVFAQPMVPEPRLVEGGVPAFPQWMRANQTKRRGEDVVHEEAEEEDAWEKQRVSAIQAEIDSRFHALNLPLSTALPCATIEDDAVLLSRYLALGGIASSSLSSTTYARSGTTFFALNLYNSEKVLPSLSRALIALSSFLEPETVHVSIFENGSTDNTTVALAHLAAALTALGTPHTILSEPDSTPWDKVDRIAQLSIYRNIALLPLSNLTATFPSVPPTSSTSQEPEDVVFINDVFVCPRDVLELLFQRRVQKADAACAMDWRENKGLAKRWNGSVKFYDNWVSRSLTGHLFRFKFDILGEWRNGVKELFDQPGEEYSKARWQKGLPVPVYSCWNGVLALSAAPFLSASISPRYASSSASYHPDHWQRPMPISAGDRPVRFRSALTTKGECSASECKTLARDFWTRGFDRWIVVPTVRVTYDLAAYLHPQLVALSSLNPPSFSKLSLLEPRATSSSATPSSAEAPVSLSAVESSDPDLDERIHWSSLTPPSAIVCFAWARGWHIDLEWWRATLERPFASVLAPARGIETE